MKISQPSVIVIVGPTASGKSEAAYVLAGKIGGEIVSADSMQVYRGMDIATAKPPAAWLQKIPHHLIDIVEPTEEYSAGRFFADARKAVDEIVARGKTPIVAGGTGLYVRVLLKGIFEGPSRDRAARAELEAELEQNGVEHLYEKLKKIDPRTASSIDPHNPRRVVRALEVMLLTKRPLAEQQSQWSGKPSGIENDCVCTVVGLQRDRNDLAARIDERVDEMFRSGLIDETRALMSRGIEKNRVAIQALGYGEVIRYLREEATLSETKKRIQIRTRQYAKRQMTWFRKERGIRWLAVGKETQAGVVVEQIEDIQAGRRQG
ncbi:MAG TPA: tRNA (adenosine(37)-N6)-dimethylallyltransferase MiaA [bacterium]|nr:tRNA (adenosine(37)-N6)-dimethylallyltransferase MiaA [bacterium]